MRLAYIVLIVCSCLINRVLANNCTGCEKTPCAPSPFSCHRYAVDPCGCCHHCVKGAWEPCGGENWEHGYCDRQLKCANITGEVLVEIPNIGICKPMRQYKYIPIYFEDDDEICPERTGCYRAVGHCDCVTKHTCYLDSQFSVEFCENENNEEYFEKAIKNRCYDRGCNIIDKRCVCESNQCKKTFDFPDPNSCNDFLVKQICVNVTCPEVKELNCPLGSVATKSRTPPGACCPTVPSYCTCDFDKCNNRCPRQRRKVIVKPTSGVPGECCDKFLCLL